MVKQNYYNIELQTENCSDKEWKDRLWKALRATAEDYNFRLKADDFKDEDEEVQDI